MKLSRTIRKILIISALSSILITFIISFISQLVFFNETIEKVKKELIEQKKKEVKNEVLMLHSMIKYKEDILEKTLEDKLKYRVNQAHNIATDIYNKNRDKDEQEIKYLIAQALKNIKFGDDNNYYLINSNSGEAILFNKEIRLGEHLNVLEHKDAKGDFIIKNQIKISKEQGEGFVINAFVKPDSNSSEEFLKLTYVKLFEPYDWHIGMGEYLDVHREKSKDELLDWLSSIKFENSQYIFVNNFSGESLIFEGKK